MKREYNRPTIEKIAFDYRNQVVAASSGELTPNANESARDFFERLLSGQISREQAIEIALKYFDSIWPF